MFAASPHRRRSSAVHHARHGLRLVRDSEADYLLQKYDSESPFVTVKKAFLGPVVQEGHESQVLRLAVTYEQARHALRELLAKRERDRKKLADRLRAQSITNKNIVMEHRIKKAIAMKKAMKKRTAMKKAMKKKPTKATAMKKVMKKVPKKDEAKDKTTIAALCVNWPFAKLLAHGHKSAEARTFTIPPCLMQKTVAIIETKTKVKKGPAAFTAAVTIDKIQPNKVPLMLTKENKQAIVGTVTFGVVTKIDDEAAFDAQIVKHLIPRTSPYYPKKFPMYLWSVATNKAIEPPKPFLPNNAQGFRSEISLDDDSNLDQ